MSQIRVVVADDHKVVLVGVQTALDRMSPQLVVVGTAHSGEELLALLDRQPCDVAVIDYSMPAPSTEAQDGLRLLQSVRKRHPALHLVVFTMIDNPSVLHAAIEAGVQGLVSKASPIEDLTTAIVAVAGNRSFVCNGLRRKLFAHAHIGDLDELSACEAEVVRLYVQGLSVTEIAAQLHRSVKTVSHQKSEAMHKLGITNPIQLYAYALEHGLKC